MLFGLPALALMLRWRAEIYFDVSVRRESIRREAIRVVQLIDIRQVRRQVRDIHRNRGLYARHASTDQQNGFPVPVIRRSRAHAPEIFTLARNPLIEKAIDRERTNAYFLPLSGMAPTVTCTGVALHFDRLKQFQFGQSA